MKRKQPPISKPRKPLDRFPPDFNFEEEISDAIPEDKMFGPVAESPLDQTGRRRTLVRTWVWPTIFREAGYGDYRLPQT